MLKFLDALNIIMLRIWCSVRNYNKMFLLSEQVLALVFMHLCEQITDGGM